MAEFYTHRSVVTFNAAVQPRREPIGRRRDAMTRRTVFCRMRDVDILPTRRFSSAWAVRPARCLLAPRPSGRERGLGRPRDARQTRKHRSRRLRRCREPCVLPPRGWKRGQGPLSTIRSTRCGATLPHPIPAWPAPVRGRGRTDKPGCTWRPRPARASRGRRPARPARPRLVAQSQRLGHQLPWHA